MRMIDADSIKWESVEEEYGARTAAVVACQSLIQNAPTIDLAKEKGFVDELVGYIFTYFDDDYTTIETLCRKLYKHGLIDKKDGEWTCNFIELADTSQTEEYDEVGVDGGIDDEEEGLRDQSHGRTGQTGEQAHVRNLFYAAHYPGRAEEGGEK